MKTLGLSALFSLSALVAIPAAAQTRPAAKPASTTVSKTTTTAKPATTASKTTTTTKTTTTSKTATPAKTTAPKAAVAAEEEAAPAKPTAPKKAPAKSSVASSTGSEFGKGSIAANLGIGFGVGYGYYGSINAMPALSLSVERGAIEGVGPGVIGIGGLVGYKGYTYKYGYGGYKASWNNYLVSVRGTYHYNILEVPKLDTYAGLSVGARIQTWNDTYWDNTPGSSGYSSSSTYITSGIFLGARYMFTNNIGGFGELGYDMSYLKIGLTAKF